MNIHLGVSLKCDRIREFGSWVRAVEDAGFVRLGLTDSPSFYTETYVTGTVAALNSTKLRFGPRVTNIVTRNLSVTASAITGIDELSGGRCFLGLGTGDSAVFKVGLKPVTVDQMREAIIALKSMFAMGSAIYEGRIIQFGYAKRKIPIYLAASGPRTLRLAGELCDGVLVGWGVAPELVKLAMQHIKEGAHLAGRNISDIDVWWLIGAGLGKTQQEAEEAIDSHLAALPNQAFRLGVQGKGVPDDLLPRVQKLIAEYNLREDVRPGRNAQNVRLVDDLGLKAYLTRRFTIAGTPEAFADQVKEVASWGATQLWFTAPAEDKLGFLRTMRDRVFPQVT